VTTLYAGAPARNLAHGPMGGATVAQPAPLASDDVNVEVVNESTCSKLQGAWDAESRPAPCHQELVAETSDEVVDHFLLGPNDVFGEMALFTGETLRAQATARTATCVLRIPSVALHNLLASNRRLQNFVAMVAIDRLRETEVFRRCTPSTVARLVTFMRQAEFEAGDVLFYDVDALCPVYFVVLGCVEVRRAARPGDTAEERRVVGSNGLLGTEHLVLGRAVHATATALERTTVLIVQRRDIDKLCEKDERFRQSLLCSNPGTDANGATAAADGGLENAALGGQALSLDPPEGAAAPAKFGPSAFEELGWVRQTTQVSAPAAVSTCIKVAESGEPDSWTDGLRRRDVRVSAGEEEEQDGEDEVGGDEGAHQGFFPSVSAADLPDLLASEAAAAAADRGHRAAEAGGEAAACQSSAFVQGPGQRVGDAQVASCDKDQAAGAHHAGEPHNGGGGGQHEQHGHAQHGGGRGVQAAVTIWLGILIDAVPESFVMGILVNTASRGTLLAFVVGVFLANFPEAMSSAGTMRLHGMRRRVILVMWASITLMTGLGAFGGATIFPPGSKDDPVIQKVIAGIEGLCGGAMLCMIANTVLPEAFEQGGNVTGMSTLLGFLVAVAVSVAA